MLFYYGALGTHKVRNCLWEALANHNLIHVYIESKNPSKIFLVTVLYQGLLFLAEDFLREGKLPKKGKHYQASLFSTPNLHRTSNQGLINVAHPTFSLRI